MQRLLPAVAVTLLALILTGCTFFEFIQSAALDTDEGIDQYRTGCVLDEATLTRLYVQYDQLSTHDAGPTPTPRPITAQETEQAALLKQLWEAGCMTGYRDGVGHGVTAATCRTRTDFNRDNWPYERGTPQELRWVTAADTVTSRDPTLDHHVALKDAFLSGGCAWTPEQKAAFSNDSFNHFWTARSFNSSKGPRSPDQLTGIAQRIIDTAPEQCAYAQRHQEVKAKYQLTMTAAEEATVTQWLAACPA